MAGFVGAFGNSVSGIGPADAREGDICAVYTDASHNFKDGYGNDVAVVARGATHGLVFRVENETSNVTAPVKYTEYFELSSDRWRGRGGGDSWGASVEVEDVEAASGWARHETFILANTPATDSVTIEAFEKDGDDSWAKVKSVEGKAVFAKVDRDAVLVVIKYESGTTVIGAHGKENIRVRVDSETGSARITSKAEILNWESNTDNVGHILVHGPTGNQLVDTMSPRYHNDADGYALNNINSWLVDVGYTGFANAANNVCGGSNDDAWGFIDFQCIQPGYFHIDIQAVYGTENTGRTVKFLCAGQADTATIGVSPATVEIVPVGNSLGSSTVTVTVLDQDGKRLEHAKVTFTTNKCRFNGDSNTEPAGGGTTVTTYTDSDTTSDTNFLTNNPLQYSAGTAEAVLNCTGAGVTPGTANITAIVDRPGADIVLTAEVKVVGQTSATGLTLTLTPDDLECGATILATAKAVDALGQNVSDGTVIYFTTDTSSGVLGGAEGAQGGVLTVGGQASALIATDPSKPGLHTVIAYTVNAAGTVNAQVSDTYVCDGAVAPAAPTVAPPATGTGSITPPNTGSAGLAAGSSSMSLMFLAGAVAFVLAGVASIRFARN